MSKDNASYCPAYQELQQAKGTSWDILGKGTQPRTMALHCPKQPGTFRMLSWGRCGFLTLPGHRDAALITAQVTPHGQSGPQSSIRCKKDVRMLCTEASSHPTLAHWHVMQGLRDTARCAMK